MIARIISAFILAMIVGLMTPGRALALLSEEEKASLNRVLQIYQKSQTMDELTQKLTPWLDLDTLLYLRKQSQVLKNPTLPKLTFRKVSRVRFKKGSNITTVDFISLRTGLIAINGVEVEFQPGDDAQTRSKKIAAVLRKNPSSARHILQALFPEARATKARATDDDDLAARAPMISDNITELSTLLSALSHSAGNRSLCDKDLATQAKKNISEVMVTCTQILDQLNNSPNSFSDAENKVINDNKKSEHNDRCDEIKEETAKELRDGESIKLGGESPKVDMSRITDPTYKMPGVYKKDDVMALHKANTLNNTIKEKLVGISQQMAKVVDEDPTERSCRAQVQDCIKKIVDTVKERTKSRRLRCFMDHILDKIGQNGELGNSTPNQTGQTPASQAPQPPRRPVFK